MKIVLVGVGGQGVLFTTRVIAEAALTTGAEVICSETHGMAQRGGSIVSHIKIGNFRSPLIRKGGADCALCFNPSELGAALQFVKDGGECIINAEDRNWRPEWNDFAQANKIALRACAANGLANGIGSVMSANQALLGYATLFCPDFPSPSCLISTIRAISRGESAEKNIAAFQAGRDSISK